MFAIVLLPRISNVLEPLAEPIPLSVSPEFCHTIVPLPLHAPFKTNLPSNVKVVPPSARTLPLLIVKVAAVVFVARVTV